MRRTALLLVLLTTVICATAQRHVVVADRNTHEPVTQASLYTRESGKFHSAITNDRGEATIGFSFGVLTVSHLNYEKRQVRQLGDTLFLTPRYRQTREVVVVNQEPAWIRPFLKRFIRTKDYRYFARPTLFDYDYQTQSITNASLYRYQSQGLLRQKNRDERQHAISQQEGVITSIDSTKLTDVANLRRMLYEDFVQELDNGFVSDHVFRENGAYESRNPNEIELVFRSKSRDDDRGRFVVDTARCVVLSAWRRCGTKSNIHLHMPRFLYLMAQAISGYRVKKWDTYYHVSYALLPDGQLYPDSVRYKFYLATHESSTDKAEEEFHAQTGGGFPNMESTLRLSPCRQAPDSVTWLPLPESWYLRLSSDNEREQEIRMAHLPSHFVLLGEEDEK